jgi:hypothetical protein
MNDLKADNKDLKADNKFRSLVPLSEQIGRAPGKVENAGERGRNFMVHWQKSDDDSPDKWNKEMVLDCKETNKVHNCFSVMAVDQIQTFGTSILKALGLKRVKHQTHSFGPGLVCTFPVPSG